MFTSHISRQRLANFASVRVLRALSHVSAISASLYDAFSTAVGMCCGKHVNKMHCATKWLHAVQVRDLPYAGHKPHMYPEQSVVKESTVLEIQSSSNSH